MMERETFMDRIKSGLPLLSGIALVIVSLLGIVMIVCLLKLANTAT